jgi:NitT/TauT family transport system permease protein
MVRSSTEMDTLAGLDALELAEAPRRGSRRLWQVTWPKLAAVAIAFGAWQIIAMSGVKPAHVLPGPLPVLSVLWESVLDGTLLAGLATTMRRAAVGYAWAIAIGLVIGVLVARLHVLRLAVGSLITGVQTMPSIAWFPFAILLFQLTEAAILFVVIIGAAPSIANGVLAGVDQVPPLLRRAGRVLGAQGWQLYRHVVLPAALPGVIAGLKQGWAFAWRSLMAGELLVIIAARTSLGTQLHFARELSNARAMLATMLVILLIGILVDVAFSAAEREVNRRRGLGEHVR